MALSFTSQTLSGSGLRYFRDIVANNNIVLASCLGSGAGIYRSVSPKTGGVWNSVLSASMYNGLVIDPTDSSRIYAGINGGISPYNSFAYSTDYGVTWTYNNSGLPGRSVPYAMAVAPDGTIYMALYSTYLGTYKGVYKNSSGGAGLWSATGWTADYININLGGFCVDPSSSNILYVAETGTNDPGGTSIWKSVDTGASWVKYNSGLDRSQMYYSLVVDPSNSNNVYAIAVPSTSGTISAKLYKSTDGGINWALHYNFGSVGLNATVPTLAFYTLYGTQYLMMGTYGGIQISEDGGASWYASGFSQCAASIAIDTAGAEPHNIYMTSGDFTSVTRYVYSANSISPKFTLSGYVRDGVGDPIEGADVIVVGYGGTISLIDGSYSISNIPYGTYDVTVSFPATDCSPQPLSLDIHSDVVQDFVCSSSIFAASGHVYNGVTLDPIEGIYVVNGSSFDITDVSGFYSLPTLAGSPYNIYPLVPSGSLVVPTSYSGTAPAGNLTDLDFNISEVCTTEWKEWCTDVVVGDETTYTATSSGMYARTTCCSETSECVSDDPILVYIGPSGGLPDAGANSAICSDDPPQALAGFTPVGGIWSGTGIVDPSGIFDPTGLPLGDYILTYTTSCGADTRTMSVVDCSIPAEAGPDQDICSNAEAFALTGFSPPGGTWSGIGITDPSGIFDPQVAQAASDPPYVLTYTYGTKSDTKTINILYVTTPSIYGTVDIDEHSIFLHVAPETYASYQWSLDGSPIPGATSTTIQITESGVYTIDVVAANGCPASFSTPVAIIGTPSFSGETICVGELLVPIVSVINVPVCQGSMSFVTEVRSSMPAGKYSIEYEAGIDIHMHEVGEWLYMGCNSKTIVYDAPPHLGMGDNPNEV